MVILGNKPTGPGFESEVHVTISSIRGGKSFRKAAACCSTSKVVGAIKATWEPCSSARKRAWAATKVLPEPTSPCRSRCIGRPNRKSASISPQAVFWSAVIEKGRFASHGPIKSRTFSGLSTRIASRAALRTSTPNREATSSSQANLRRATSTSGKEDGK